MADEDTSVRVAVRIRPQIARELIDNLGTCTSVNPGQPLVQLGKGNLFTYDYVFDTEEIQTNIYEACVSQLVEGALEGYNATVIAYGQTGSGKTYTMGTGYELTCGVDNVGMLPRAIRHIFSGIESRQEQAREAGLPVPEFRVEAQFIELYNESLYDLLEPDRSIQEPKNIRIHGDHYGGISVEGVLRTVVKTDTEAMSCLRNGALSRSTGETQMNQQSSRSHAIYTLHIQQRRLASEESEEKENGVSGDFETLSSKFHFVDLAGSERLHRTGATGDRAKEGISINCGLLALGNVISALGDKSKRAMHVPYRDSKLTRLLQDSLGGNSRTVMIACISPSTQDFMETLSTLKYANRARNIKNRVTINQDKYSQQLSQLRQEVQRLQLELLDYKQGKRVVGSDGEESVNDMFHENQLLLTDNNNLRLRLKAQQDTIETLTARNTDLKTKLATSSWVSQGGDAESSNQIHEMLHKYVQEVEDLTSKLMESEALCQQLRANNTKITRNHALSPRPSTAGMEFDCSSNVMNLIEAAKKGIQRDQDMLQRSKSEILHSKIEQDSESSSEEEDDLDSDSDSEDEKEQQEEEQRMGELVCLESEINIKQQLIDQLELSQRRMHSMKQQYEDKLRQLEARMEATKIERDKVLASLSGKGGAPDGNNNERVKKVKDEYERKLANMQKELKTLNTAKKEHAKVLKEHSRNESQLRQLRTELSEMKKTKVRLLNKMKEESSRHKLEQERRSREVAQLRKANRKHENQIRSLEAEKRAKDVVLKRRQEEVTALRRNQFSGMSNKASGRLNARKGGSSPPLILSFPPTSSKPPVGRTEGYRGVPALQRKLSTFSPKVARQKWSVLEKNITQISLTKKTIADLDHQLESHLEARKQHGIEQAQLKKRLSDARAMGDEEEIHSIKERLKEIQAGIDFTQDVIEDTQQAILQMEDTRDGSEPTDFEQVINEVDELGEARYLISKLYAMTVNKSVEVAQKEQDSMNKDNTIRQMEQRNVMQEELLQHVMQQQGLTRTISSSTITIDPPQDSYVPTDSSDESRAPSPNPSICSIASSTRSKARKRTADPQQMLYMRESFMNSPYIETTSTSTQLMPPPPRTSLARMNNPSQTSPMMVRKQYEQSSMVSPRMARRNTYTVKSSLGQSAQLGSMEQGLDATPPSSPPTYRRSASREEKNVFSRLTSTTGVTRDEKPGYGVISQFGGRVAHKCPLICTHVAEGHSKAVLSVDATEDLLFSSSKDRTVKVWDLNQGRERDSLNGHPNNVVAVKYCERTGLVFSVSNSFVKVWDLRQNPARPIHTLCSSGNTANGSFAMPDHLDNPVGAPINDIALSAQGEYLYSAAGGKVRVWDLRRFEKAGQLIGGHQAAVMCLAVGGLSQLEDRVITGSKDHYIKVFDVPRALEGYLTQPTINLDPPHYDGVQSLVLSSNTLFSGSRDFSIKKWDLQRKECVHSINGAHKDWVCGLAMLHDGLLVSGCRGGILKLWATHTCLPLGEIKAHNSPINAVATNSTCIFSASNDQMVKIWRPRPSLNL